MATYTENLGLTKPDGTDHVNVEDLNGNFDKLDDFSKKNISSENGVHGLKYDEETNTFSVYNDEEEKFEPIITPTYPVYFMNTKSIQGNTYSDSTIYHSNSPNGPWEELILKNAIGTRPNPGQICFYMCKRYIGCPGYYEDVVVSGNYEKTSVSGISNTSVDATYKIHGPVYITSSYYCLTGDTLITMADGTEKRLDKICVGDEVLSFDWETMILIPNKVIYTDKDENKSHVRYDRWTFEDGTVIKTVHRHEFYNDGSKRMKYMDEWKLGEHAYRQDGKKVALVSHETVEETVRHYKITGERGTNYFANGFLTGDRYCPQHIDL